MHQVESGETAVVQHVVIRSGHEGSVKTEAKPNHEVRAENRGVVCTYVFIFFFLFYFCTLFCNPGHYPFKVLSHFMQGMCS
jgi:hypothetical protein